jgi:GST-like protein
MHALSTLAVDQRWPPENPNILQLYSSWTANGVKVSIVLEEIGLPYEVHAIDLARSETWTPEFLSLNPNGKIPAIIDPNGPDGRPMALFESGAILVYLAEKSGRLLPAQPTARYETLQWLFFQVGGVGPTFGQLAYFHKFAGREIEDKRPFERYRAETQRLLGVLEGRLEGRQWVMGEEYTIADIALIGWIRNLTAGFDVGPPVHYEDLKNVPAWLQRCLARPAVQRGLDSRAGPAK